MASNPERLRTERLILRGINETDAIEIVEWRSDPEVYRYFKECRNCIIHSGGRTNQNLVDAYAAISGLLASDLDVAEVPDMQSVTSVDALVTLSLRGVVGFSQIVIKLVEVLDMEFIKADKALDCFVAQIKEFTPYPEYPSQDENKAKKMIEGIMRRSGFLPPIHSNEFYQLLKSWKGVSSEQ